MLAQLRELRGAIDAVLVGAERLLPVVAAWVAAQRPGEAPQERVEVAPEVPGPPNGSFAPGGLPVRAAEPSEAATPQTAECVECGASFVGTRRGGNTQRFCTPRCRATAHQRRRRAAPQAEGAADPDPGPLPDEVERPFRLPVDGEDPRGDVLAAAARLPWEDAAAP
jgi:hypothetical protein